MVDEKMKYEIQEEIIPSQSFHWPISVSEEGMNLPFWVNAVGIDTYKKHFYLKREGYPDYQLLYVMEGNLDVTYAKNTFTMEAADMVLVHHKPFTTIKTGDKGYAKLAFIHISGYAIASFYEMCYQNGLSNVRVSNPGLVIETFEAIKEAALLVGGMENDLFISQKCYTLLTYYLSDIKKSEREKSQKSMPEWCADAVNFMRANIADNINFKVLCQRYYLSPSQFTRGFKKHMGMLPSQYLTKLRVELAKQLLLKLNDNISIISAYAGFSNPNRFIQNFKQYNAGLSPAKYRKIFLK